MTLLTCLHPCCSPAMQAVALFLEEKIGYLDIMRVSMGGTRGVPRWDGHKPNCADGIGRSMNSLRDCGKQAGTMPIRSLPGGRGCLRGTHA